MDTLTYKSYFQGKLHVSFFIIITIISHSEDSDSGELMITLVVIPIRVSTSGDSDPEFKGGNHNLYLEKL